MARIPTLLHRLIRDTGGNFATIFAVTLIPVALTVGLTVDYSNWVNKQGRVQDAIDAATLAAAIDLDKTPKERIAIARDFMDSKMTEFGWTATYDFQVDENARVITGSAQIFHKPAFGGLFGIKEVDIPVHTTVNFGQSLGAEIVMVLDWSGSMGSNDKWRSLQTSAYRLVDTVSSNGSRDDVYFGIVPFTDLVHVTLPSSMVRVKTSDATWTGCTQDRRHPWNTLRKLPNASNGSKWGETPGATQRDCDRQVANGLMVQPLTNDHKLVKGAISAMRPGGMTHLALGMSFGWHLVSPEEPYTQAKEFDDESVEKFVIFMTDGVQTADAWGPYGRRSVFDGNANIDSLCNNMKKDGVTVATIAFDLGDNATNSRLQRCASSSDYFFRANDNDALLEAFEKIADMINGRIRITS